MTKLAVGAEVEDGFSNFPAVHHKGHAVFANGHGSFNKKNCNLNIVLELRKITRIYYSLEIFMDLTECLTA